MPDADLHPNRRLHYWHTGVAQWHEHSQWDFHRPCNCEGQLPNSPEFLMGFFDCLNFIIESTLYALSWSLGFHYNLFMCLFPWCKREITYWVHSFSCPALNAEGQRKRNLVQDTWIWNHSTDSVEKCSSYHSQFLLVFKVLHGADSDVEWLQKDFGLYLVNMFDTHQAARLLNLGKHSLDHLLKLYCNVDADKQYQLADWRIR